MTDSYRLHILAVRVNIHAVPCSVKRCCGTSASGIIPVPWLPEVTMTQTDRVLLAIKLVAILYAGAPTSRGE